MRRNGLLQSELTGILAGLGHTQYIVISDAGLPVPKGVKCIDLALHAGTPSFLEVLQTLLPECVFESYTIASEIQQKNGDLLRQIRRLAAPLTETMVSHEDLKLLSQGAACIVRTGEASPYANILLTGGVNF